MATSAASKYGARLRDTNLDSRGGATPQNLLEKFVQKLLITLFSEGDGGDSCSPVAGTPVRIQASKVPFFFSNTFHHPLVAPLEA